VRHGELAPETRADEDPSPEYDQHSGPAETREQSQAKEPDGASPTTANGHAFRAPESAADTISYQNDELTSADNNDLPRREAVLEGGDYGKYDASMKARIAEENELLTRQEEGLPTRQEAREQIWGDTDTGRTPGIADASQDASTASENRTSDDLAARGAPDVPHPDTSETTEEIKAKIDKEIDRALEKVNPRWEQGKSAYGENCTGVVQAYELRRRGFDAQAGPLEKELRSDEGGLGGRTAAAIEKPWGRNFTTATKQEIDKAFEDPGSRGIVRISWNYPLRGAHVFNVENVGGEVRYVDGQPTPPQSDASRYFNVGGDTAYIRTDDLPTPEQHKIKNYVEMDDS
jgi:hypothetical protein